MLKGGGQTMLKQTKWRTALLAMAGIFFAGLALGGSILTVQVRDGHVRATPSFLGKIVGTLHYGDRVTTLSKNGDWQQVNTPRARGWMHSASLAKSNVSLQAGGRAAPLAASNDELALAGKGFNKQVESAFKARHPQMNYAWVDRMEAIKIPPEEMTQFLRQGGLTPEGGAQ
jgi:hypothetical protein